MDVTKFDKLARETCDVARWIFQDQFAHDEALDSIPKTARKTHQGKCEIPIVDSADDVKVGDLLVIFEATRSERAYGRFQALVPGFSPREIVLKYRAEFARVVKVNKKTFEIVYMRRPGNAWSTDLASLSEATDPVRISGSGNSREVGNLGSYDQLVQAMAEHPQFAAWHALWREAGEVNAELTRQAQEDRQAKDAIRKPLKAAVEAINTATAMRLVEMNWDGLGAHPCNDFLAKQGNFDIYVAGLVATGHLSLEGSVIVADARRVLKI